MKLSTGLIPSTHFKMSTSDRALERAVEAYYLGNLTGGSYVESHIFQKGSGVLSSVLSSIGRAALPVLRKLGGYAAKKGVRFAGNAINDVISGKNVKEALRNSTRASVENLTFDAVNAMERGQRKRPRKKRRAPPQKKRKIAGGGGSTLW